MKIMPRYNFGEFLGYFPSGLNPFKIQTKFTMDLIPKILIQLLLGISISSQKENCSFRSILPLAKFGNLWTSGRLCFCNLKFECSNQWEIYLVN
jgi:hypothetical protein